MQNDDILDAEAAGIYLGGANKPISYQTLANWRVMGNGPRFTRINGRTIRYRRADLDAWLSRQRTFSSTSEQAA